MKGNTARKIDSGRLQSMEDLNALRQHLKDKRDPNRPEVVVCHGTGCMANGSAKVTRAFKEAFKSAGIDAKVMPGIKTTGCRTLEYSAKAGLSMLPDRMVVPRYLFKITSFFGPSVILFWEDGKKTSLFHSLLRVQQQ